MIPMGFRALDPPAGTVGGRISGAVELLDEVGGTIGCCAAKPDGPEMDALGVVNGDAVISPR